MSMFFETCKSLCGQEHSFILDSASRHDLIAQTDFLKFYPSAKIQPTKEKVIGANLQPLQFLGTITISIISASCEAVHCYFLVQGFPCTIVQEKDFTLLGVRAMRKLGATFSLFTVVEETTNSEILDVITGTR